ncbi:MAG TPA: cation diffusion facilitator family transporter [Acidobacteriaceae bacterium]|jgi:cobalt-zinc-cadmium efflux system protein|nr:cation diffusion facilitator family transporter [Acidobacteriaceae bacterium]
MHVHGANTRAMQKVLRISLIATIGYVLLTLVAGLRAHSLALVSEAGHNASDALALVLSFVAVWFQTRPATDRKTYGYQRAGVLAAFLNAIALIVISGWIVFEAIHRFGSGAQVQPRLMMYVAAVGVLMNGIIAALLWRVSHDVNIRSVFIHMLGDTLSTAAVIVGGAVILFTGRSWVDPALSLGIAALILWSSFAIVRETLNILLEGAPRGVSLVDIHTTMMAIGGVEDVHDLHVWSLGSNTHALSCHVTIADIPPSESTRILADINLVLRDRFRIHHTTLQFEHVICEVAHGCPMAVEEPHEHSHAHGHAH